MAYRFSDILTYLYIPDRYIYIRHIGIIYYNVYVCSSEVTLPYTYLPLRQVIIICGMDVIINFIIEII